MFYQKVLKGNAGFTLIELMVAVGITGAISAIAVPNYLKYVGKSRQAEAKIALSAIYISEKQFGTEFGYYTACLNKAGFVAQPDRYYAIGFTNSAAGAGVCGASGDKNCNNISSPSTTLDCSSSNDWIYPAQLKVSGDVLADQSSLSPSGFTFPNATGGSPVSVMTGVGKVAFSAGAAGSVSNNSNLDLWYINSNKTLINIQNAL
jgi:prepilin-type N-terminal cleavage/methylation domain-containing protein